MPGYDEKQRDRIYKYRAEKYARIGLDLSKDEKERYKTAATAAGETLNGYIKKAVNQRIDRERQKKDMEGTA